VLKSFVSQFYPEQIQAFLNDIVVEGFFTNPAYKTEFAAKVFACSETLSKIEEFEHKFDKDEQFDYTNLRNLAIESHTNRELGRKLSKKIDNINALALHLLQSEVKALKGLYEIILTLLSETHKSKTENITNIKMLFSSVRNRDSVEILEKEFNLWNFFLEIMKNYVIINNTDKHE
jgi:beta-phosphoglucomutase-like phosphatase (HAD superfamily)